MLKKQSFKSRTVFDVQKFNVMEKLPIYIAGGKPTADTIMHYETEIENFLIWCSTNSYNPLTDINEEKAFEYFGFLENAKYSAASISLKICAARTFYFVANRLNIFNLSNPFQYIQPKKATYDDADFNYFTTEELTEICNSIIERAEVTAQRDLAMVMLMSVEGLRTVEVHRMCDEDIDWDRKKILVHGKGKDAYIFPCEDTFEVLKAYIEDRPTPVNDSQGTPTFIGYSKKFFGARISRNGIRWSINHILEAVNMKTKGNSCHTLRHSCGTNLYTETKDLRVVQETLRHSDPETSARYAHVVERQTNRRTSTISPLKK